MTAHPLPDPFTGRTRTPHGNRRERITAPENAARSEPTKPDILLPEARTSGSLHWQGCCLPDPRALLLPCRLFSSTESSVRESPLSDKRRDEGRALYRPECALERPNICCSRSPLSPAHSCAVRRGQDNPRPVKASRLERRDTVAVSRDVEIIDTEHTVCQQNR